MGGRGKAKVEGIRRVAYLPYRARRRLPFTGYVFNFGLRNLYIPTCQKLPACDCDVLGLTPAGTRFPLKLVRAILG